MKEEFSDDSSDSFESNFYEAPGGAPLHSNMNSRWEAVESLLYNEDCPETDNLPHQIIQECKLWKDSFPYLRIRGRKIIDPNEGKRNSLKDGIVTSVVNEIVEKFTSNGFKIDNDSGVNRPMAPCRESYFERGKKNNHVPMTSQEVISSCVKQSSMSLPTPRIAPRGILKNSPHRPKPEERISRKNKEFTYRNASLPRITSKNNWLNQSEQRRISDSLPHPRFSSQSQKQKIMQGKEKFKLPPITANILGDR